VLRFCYRIRSYPPDTCSLACQPAPTWLRVLVPPSCIIVVWLMMLGLCSLLGPMDPARNELLRGGIYICSFITGRFLVPSVSIWRWRARLHQNDVSQQPRRTEGD
jgi:hypothetical protein